MAFILLSRGEKTFILNGIVEDLRVDGRTRLDYRPLELETGLVNNASGSARLRLANTDILVGIKAEIDKPDKDKPNKGKIEFFVDCSANATPQFEGRGGERLATNLAQTLDQHYESNNALELESLCILEGQQCWKLFVDILILECGGNLYDAVSMAAKAALFNTRLPVVTAEIMDAGEQDLVISDDPYKCTRLNVQDVPILVTICKTGDMLLIDPSAEEEECSSGSVVLGVSNDTTFSGMHTSDTGSFPMDLLENAMKLANAVGTEINGKLLKALQSEEEKRAGKRFEAMGFLK